ncbi:MAG TPA: DUF1223 domain-containing protein [Rhizomicrobium sp.]|jgi:hypothetical protein|nr:DUF1223 domain-containing protein [Rhizomicrobium sp.]
MAKPILTSVLVAAALGATALPTQAAQPVVVELFTSQGCSSCPPANASLAAVAGRADVLALSFGVTYWDYLGWKDTFAQPQFTQRQIAYEPGLGHDGPFTPQIVVDGTADTVGDRQSDVEHLIGKARLNGPAIDLKNDVVSVAAAPARGASDVWLVRYDPRTVEVSVARGENEGVTLPHKNVVRELTRLGAWTGAAANFPISPAQAGLKTAVLIQKPRGGAIIAAYKE